MELKRSSVYIEPHHVGTLCQKKKRITIHRSINLKMWFSYIVWNKWKQVSRKTMVLNVTILFHLFFITWQKINRFFRYMISFHCVDLHYINKCTELARKKNCALNENSQLRCVLRTVIWWKMSLLHYCKSVCSLFLLRGSLSRLISINYGRVPLSYKGTLTSSI